MGKTVNICLNTNHPECNGEYCACVECVLWEEWGFCVEHPCELCEGPVAIRCYPEEVQEQLDAICKADPISFDGEDDVIEELNRCRSDSQYFIDKCIYIVGNENAT